MTDLPNAAVWAAPDEHPSGSAVEVEHPLPEAGPPSTDRRRRRKWIILGVAVPVVVIALFAAAVGGFYLWSQTQFSVLEREGAVVVQRGVGPFAGYEPTDVKLALLPTTARNDLVAHISADGRAGAAAIITDLRDQVTTCEGSLKAPCPIRPLETASVSTTRHEYPRGNEITISWGSIDSREGVATKLTIDGKKPPKGCPATLTSTGICTLKGTFDTTYTIAAKTTGPAGSSAVVSQVEEFTQLKPRVWVSKGKQFRGKTTDTHRAGRFCPVELHTEGFAPDTDYKVKVLMSGHKSVKIPFTTDGSGTFSSRVYAYGDPTRHSWVAVDVKGVRSKNLPWACGGL
jgi:hypothetical protein